MLVRSVADDGPVVGRRSRSAAVPFRLAGAAAYFQRAEVRDVLAWLRLLADPADSGAVVRALSRPPIELRSVDVARLTQLARRRKLDMVRGDRGGRRGAPADARGTRPRAGLPAPLPRRLPTRSRTAAGPLRAPPDRADRPAPPAGVRHPGRHRRAAGQHRQARRTSPPASCAASRAPPRDFARYLAAVAEAGLPEEEVAAPEPAGAVQVMTMHAAKGREFDHVFVLGLSRGRLPGPRTAPGEATCPMSCSRSRCRRTAGSRAVHEAEMRRLLHVAMTRARRGLVLSWAETGERGAAARPSPFVEEARAAVRWRRGARRGGAVRPGRGPPLDLPDDARRAARHGVPGGRAARRDAARHLPRRVAGGGALPGAAQGRRADRALQGRAAGGARRSAR